MFPIDLSDARSLPTAVLVAQTRPTSTATGTPAIQTVGVCLEAEISLTKSVATTPGAALEEYLRNSEKLADWHLAPSGITISVLGNPDHGLLSDPSGIGNYLYTPTAGYLGPDNATFLVDTGSRQFKLVYFIHVNNEADAEGQVYCDQTIWRISLSHIDAASSQAGFISPSSILNYQLKNVDVSLNFATWVNDAPRKMY